eukprot:c17153_g1_i2.p1 GENE.c17153_g1_i2~~c17153_g1_i2.p1  ORF type:complete len:185 (+),score=80.89 c17153_g1_i2:56-556(+)
MFGNIVRREAFRRALFTNVNRVPVRFMGSHPPNYYVDDNEPVWNPRVVFPLPKSPLSDTPCVTDLDILDGKAKLPEETELWIDDGRAQPEFFLDVSSTEPREFLAAMGVMACFLAGVIYCSTLTETPYFGKKPTVQRVLPHEQHAVEFGGIKETNLPRVVLPGQHF